MFLHAPIVNQVDLFFFYATLKTNKNTFENIFLLDCVNIYFSQSIDNYVLSIVFQRIKSVGLPYNAYIVILTLTS